MLTIHNFKKTYGSFKLNCSLKVHEGQVTGLIGANGAGKSTTFKAILDLISIDSGKIQIFGKNHKNISLKNKESIRVVMGNI